MERLSGTKDPAGRAGRARVDRGGSFVTSIVARRPVTGGECEATASVNSPVKPTVEEIGKKEIGKRKIGGNHIGEQEIGRSTEEIGRSTSSQTRKFSKQSQRHCKQGQEIPQVKIGTCAGPAFTSISGTSTASGATVGGMTTG